MRTLRTIVSAVLVSSMAVGVTSCAPAVDPEVDHKAKTTACLIRSTIAVPGTPEKQLAADLVEAKILYGLAVREVKIDQRTEQVPARLLQALQAGCVLMVSANTEYIADLAQFAKEHPRMMVLFVGGDIAASDQPANFRWVADDIQAAARLAGYFAARKSDYFARVNLFVQGNYFQSKSIEGSFVAGVYDAYLDSGVAAKVFSITSKEKLSELVSFGTNEVVVVFAGKSIWQSLPLDKSEGAFLIGADLQLGETTMNFDSLVQVSVERNTSKYVLNAVSSLLDRKFDSDPRYRKPGALKFKTVELRISQPDSIDGALLEALNTYEQELLAK